MDFRLLTRIIILFSFICGLLSSNNEKWEHLCNHTCHSGMNGTVVEEICSQNDTKIYDRCCVNKTNETVIGINLKKCEISNISGMFHNFDSLQVIMLEENPLVNVTSEDFSNILHIDYLSIPSNFKCPGGDKSWNHTTTESNSTECLQEINFCKAYNVSCPPSSQCVNTAPGLTECHCSPGYHGYKCLRKGTFPKIIFSAGLVVSAVVVSGLLWFTQRRHAKKVV